MNEIRDKFSRPFPVRLMESSEENLDRLAKETGLSRSELIRRACAWALPKFLSGELPVVQTAEGGAA